MILYIENLKDSTKKLLELIKWQDTKLISRNQSHFYTPIVNYQKGQLRKQTPLQLHQKIKYLGINLNKDVNDLHLENYKALKKDIEQDMSKWKHIMCSWIGRINIIKMSILPKAIYRFNTIPVMLLMAWFTELEEIFQNWYGTTKDPK